ncbi:MAG: archease [Actinomycetota bacterium]
MRKYSITEHPSDIGIKAWASGPHNLFSHTAEGMFEIMADFKKIRPEKKIDISIREDCPCGYEEALVAWLEELIFRFETEKMLFCRFEVKELVVGKKLAIDASAWGERIKARHNIRVAIKAVTYHGLKVERNKDWKAHVIFDV